MYALEGAVLAMNNAYTTLVREPHRKHSWCLVHQYAETVERESHFCEDTWWEHVNLAYMRYVHCTEIGLPDMEDDCSDVDSEDV